MQTYNCGEKKQAQLLLIVHKISVKKTYDIPDWLSYL